MHESNDGENDSYFAVCGVSWAEPPKKPDQEDEAKIEMQGQNIKVQYNSFVFLRTGGKVLALHMMPDPRYGWDGVTYTCHVLNDGTNNFFRVNPPDADGKPNPNLVTITGQADELEGEPTIVVGDWSVEWSEGNHEFGWLYLETLEERVDFYPRQFRTLAESHGKLDAGKWVSNKPPVAANHSHVDSYEIDLSLAPEVVEFEGFVNYGSPITQTITESEGQPQEVEIND